jgi:hypothetical protein
MRRHPLPARLRQASDRSSVSGAPTSSEAERFTAAKTAKDTLQRGLAIFNTQVGRPQPHVGFVFRGCGAENAAPTAHGLQGAYRSAPSDAQLG